MKKIDTSPITDAAQMTVKQGTLDHIQSAYQEMGAATLAGLVQANTTTSVTSIIFGCRLTVSGGNYTVTQGAILYNGEVFLVDAVTSTANPSGGDTRIAKIVTTYLTAANADPVTFTDSSTHSIHEIRKIVIENGTSSTSGYIADYEDLTRMYSGDIGATGISYSSNYEVSFDRNRNLYFSSAGSVAFTFDLSNVFNGGAQRFVGELGNTDTLSLTGATDISFEFCEGANLTVYTNSSPLPMLHPLKTASGTEKYVIEFTYLGYVSSIHRIGVKLWS